MIKPTLQEKYDFICSQLEVHCVDYWEQDALLILPEDLYFQFNIVPPHDVDAAIELLMNELQG